MNFHIITNSDYQNWSASRFKYTTFTNSMKWYSTEKIQDAMIDFTKENDISLKWVNSLSPDELRETVEKRINYVISRYESELIT
ncbi:hypothetical protein Ahy_B06g083765 [Arachis hypogaea]|uniref:Uncharacterized protein n=1 Tax=Arachis hypogaea TaxID=3818 RepID=A0A444YQD9_ARAHY|nr:hypothetical protein Ahy_B06g083765 [Arachis hypogaea]